jgi:hypothetical protein
MRGSGLLPTYQLEYLQLVQLYGQVYIVLTTILNLNSGRPYGRRTNLVLLEYQVLQLYLIVAIVQL